MWFLSDALFGYLSGRSIAKKIVDLFFVCTLFSWIAFVYVVASNFPTFKQLFVAERPNLGAMIKLDKSIEEVLTTAMHDIGSDRVSVGRFHDSVSDVQGRHFVYESRSNEVVQPGVASGALYRQNILLSIMNFWARDLIQNKCIATVVQPAAEFAQFYQQIGVKADLKCPINNTNGVLVGFITIDYITRAPTIVEMKQKEPRLREAAAKIGAILSVNSE